MKYLNLLLAAAACGAFGTLAQAADTYKIDPVHSSVVFGIKHLGVASVYGRFNDVSGTVTFDKDDASKSSVQIEVKVESIDTNNDKRNQHLKSPDFFNAQQFPLLTFKSTKVEASGNVYKVTGDLTIHGVTKSQTIDFTKGADAKGMQGEARSGGDAQFVIKRSDFGMKFMPQAIGDEVSIILGIEGVKQ